MRKKILLISIVPFLIALGVYWVFPKNKHAVSASPEVWVKTAAVKQTEMPSKVQALGTITAKSVVITPEIAGHVKKIFFEDGSYIRKGDPLIQLDDSVYQSQSLSANASLLYSEQDLKRKKLLGKRGAIAQQMIDQAAADFKEKEAAAVQARVSLSKMLLRAPFDGKIGRALVNPGDYVTIGQNLTSITDIKHLRVEYNLPESAIAKIQTGQTVSVSSNAYPQQHFIGRVTYISPTIDAANRSISLYAALDNESNALVPGMFVNVEQTFSNNEQVLLVPAKSLVPILEGEQVYKVIDGKAYATKIIIGKRIDNDVQILQGLTANDVIVTDGQLKIGNGMPVKAKT